MILQYLIAGRKWKLPFTEINPFPANKLPVTSNLLAAGYPVTPLRTG